MSDGDDAPESVKEIVRRAVGLLAAGEHAELERWTEGVRLSAQDIAWTLVRLIITEAEPGRYSVELRDLRIP